MKNTFKKMPLILYLCLFGLIFSCSPEQDILKSPQKNSRISQKPFKELLLLNSFNNAYEKVKTEKQKNLASRSALEDEYNFTVSEKHLVKIYEVDEKTYYNIFIKREAVDATYFENLLLINEKINGENVPTGYILKYRTPIKEAAVMIEQHEFFETTSTPLFGRITVYCFTACSPICYVLGGSYTTAHVANSAECVTSHILCEEICREVPSGGGFGSSGSGSEGGSSDGGGGGGSSSGGGNGSTPPPPNDCGTCNPPPPVILPVLPEDEDFGPPVNNPCEELKKLTENLNIKNTYTEAPNGLNHKVNSYKEFGFAFARTDIGDTTTPVPNSSIEPNILDMSNFVGGDFFGASHTHANIEYGVFPMFPLPDLLYLFKVAFKFESNGEPKDYSIFVLTLTVPAGTYAIKIKDVAKFFTFINSPNFEEQKEKLENKFIDIGLTNQNQLTKELLNVLEKNDVGVGLYKIKPDFSDWSELKLNPFVTSTSTNDNSINEIPCNTNK
jgi:hypothetical protein